MNKTLYRSLILISFLALNALILLGIGAIWRYMNTGADRSAMLNESEAFEVFYQDIAWVSPDTDLQGFGEELKKAIGKDYLRAWAARNRAFFTNQSEWLRDFHTENAYKKLSGLISENQISGIHLEQMNLSHSLQPIYLSADKTLAIIRDLEAVWHRRVLRDDKVVFSESGSKAYEFVLLLEDGSWRIRQMRALPGSADTFSSGAVKHNSERGTDSTGPGVKAWEESIKGIRGINYYPAQAPWAHFTESYDPEVSDSDLERMQSMGINTVRIFFPYEASGGAEADGDFLNRLRDFMDRAQARDIQVILTLFDFYGDYSLYDWPATRAHLKALVGAFKDHPALLAWDIKNEPDLDFENRGEQEVLEWLKMARNYLRQWDGEHPVTIGWSAPEASSFLSEEMDFISFHYYGDPEEFQERYTKSTQGTLKPILLGEFGRSSYRGLWNAFSGSESDQQEYYQQMAWKLEQLSLPFLSWTLYDYEEVPWQVAGRAPWKRKPQGSFGLLKADGSKKPAAKPFIELLVK